jgi:serine/threonine protein kinase
MLTTRPRTLPTLRNYELLDRIAEGGMATVYRGRDRRSGAVVAIKIAHPGVADDKVLAERFRNEFRAGSVLNHPNIVRTLDFGQEEQTLYLALEYVEGLDLWDQIARRGRLPEAEAVDLIVQVARGLHEAHRHGFIHRDIKPDNILLAADGTPKLTDLGLIKDLEADFNLTRTRKGLGTPNFAAPEQFSDARRADIRCDIYSLGLTLYMAVTAELPFQAKTLAATIKKKLSHELTPPRQLVPELSERLEWAIRRAAHVEPERRYASCLEFIQALTGEGADEQPSAAMPGRPKRERPEQDRRRSVRYPCALPTLCDVLTAIHEGMIGGEERWPGDVVDLSVTGIALVLRRRFEPGTLLRLELQSADRAFKCRPELELVRVERGRGGRWFLAGTFTSPLDRDDLRKLL